MLTYLETKTLCQNRLGLLLLSFCIGQQSLCFLSLLSRWKRTDNRTYSCEHR